MAARLERKNQHVRDESRDENSLGEGALGGLTLTPPEVDLMRIYHTLINEALQQNEPLG